MRLLIYTRDMLRGAAALAVVTLLGLSCSRADNKTAPTAFTDDESYLIESYIDVRHARSFYALDEAQAESLFTHLGATVDTVRIARTTAVLNSTPDRWLDVFAEIERRLKGPAEDDESEPGGDS